MSVISAYEKMLKDGSASKPIRISQPTPDNPEGGMGGGMNSMKSALDESKDNDEFAYYDSKMKERLEERISKKSSNESSVIKKLEGRIDLLEGIVAKIMKAQMELIKNG
jgi:hypothetical protein